MSPISTFQMYRQEILQQQKDGISTNNILSKLLYDCNADLRDNRYLYSMFDANDSYERQLLKKLQCILLNKRINENDVLKTAIETINTEIFDVDPKSELLKRLCAFFSVFKEIPTVIPEAFLDLLRQEVKQDQEVDQIINGLSSNNLLDQYNAPVSVFLIKDLIPVSKRKKVIDDCLKLLLEKLPIFPEYDANNLDDKTSKRLANISKRIDYKLKIQINALGLLVDLKEWFNDDQKSLFKNYLLKHIDLEGEPVRQLLCSIPYEEISNLKLLSLQAIEEVSAWFEPNLLNTCSYDKLTQLPDPTIEENIILHQTLQDLRTANLLKDNYRYDKISSLFQSWSVQSNLEAIIHSLSLKHNLPEEDMEGLQQDLLAHVCGKHTTMREMLPNQVRAFPFLLDLDLASWWDDATCDQLIKLAIESLAEFPLLPHIQVAFVHLLEKYLSNIKYYEAACDALVKLLPVLSVDDKNNVKAKLSEELQRTKPSSIKSFKLYATINEYNLQLPEDQINQIISPIIKQINNPNAEIRKQACRLLLKKTLVPDELKKEVIDVALLAIETPSGTDFRLCRLISTYIPNMTHAQKVRLNKALQNEGLNPFFINTLKIKMNEINECYRELQKIAVESGNVKSYLPTETVENIMRLAK